MPERRRLGTGENITRSGLTAHSITRRPKSSAQPATGGELLTEQCDVRKLTCGCQRKSPLSGGPKNGEQASDDAVAYAFPWRGVKSDVRLQGVLPSALKFELDRGRLLNLLVGHTIYNDATVAIRELLQNAIDAVRFQHHLSKRDALAQEAAMSMGSVRVHWRHKERALIVEDDGTGMDKDVIQNHLMKVGSSFYNTPRFEAENRGFTPISRFGIGILTCFMISDDVEIITCRAGRAHRIRMTSVEADYLLRELPLRDPKLSGLTPHGTRVTLILRERVRFEKRSVADILRFWVILPECRVEYVESGKASEKVGFASTAEALDYYHRTDKSRESNSSAKVEIITRQTEIGASNDRPPGSYDLAIAVQSGWYPDKSFARRPKGLIPGVCVEGIRVASVLPWFPEAGPDGLSCIMSVRNNPMLRTTVSRSAIERDDAYDKLGMLCLEMLTEHVRDEVRRIADLPGQPCHKQVQQGSGCTAICLT